MRALVLLIVMLLAGCADTGSQATSDLSNLYGERFSLQENSTVGLLTGVLVGEDRVIEMPAGGLIKSPPGVNDGTTHTVTAPEFAPVMVQFDNASSLGGFLARWSIHDVGTDTWTYVNQTASDPIKVGNGTGGPFHVLASLYDGSRLVAETDKFSVATTVSYRFTSSVWPVNPAGAAPLTDAQRAEMADFFAFDLLGRALVTIDTGFDGTYTPADGSDVDLELADATGRGVAYVAGIASSVPAASDSTEHMEITLEEGTWQARVGYVSTICGGCQYVNAGTVPYWVTILIEYKDHAKVTPE